MINNKRYPVPESEAIRVRYYPKAAKDFPSN